VCTPASTGVICAFRFVFEVVDWNLEFTAGRKRKSVIDELLAIFFRSLPNFF
jgi:hypothetical protein